MQTNLIIEYTYIQILILVLAFFSFKRMKRLYKKDDNNNGYGIGSSFGVLLGLLLFSVGAFYSNIIQQVSFGDFILNIISEIFK